MCRKEAAIWIFSRSFTTETSIPRKKSPWISRAYPAEEIAVDIASDPKYKELSSKLAEAGKQAENADDETQQIVRRYREAFEDLISLHELHAFKIGFIRGAELRKAISKTNEPSV